MTRLCYLIRQFLLLFVFPIPITLAAEAKVVEQPYDFIIAGGGLAGCVLAERLSASHPTKRILVLEAGRPDYNNFFIRMPAGILRLFRSVYDWQYESGGEKACNGRNIFLQRGKVLGGSSCTNVCLHHRGSAKDYDDWNIPGWSAADVLPFFKAAQNDETGRSENYHGHGGEWNMAEVRYQNPLSLTFLKVGEAAGLGTNVDFNDWSHPQDGVGRFQVSQLNGERCSGASAFLSKATKRPNVVIRTGAMVRRVEIDAASKTTQGVTYDLVGDDSYTSFTAKLAPNGEVLVTGGAIASPQILMASGIGPAKHLRSHGIPVVVDNPNVGENLQDHPSAVVAFRSKGAKGVSVTSKLRTIMGLTNPIPVLQWLLFKTGLLTSVGCDHGGFVRTTPTALQPDLQFRFIPARALGPDGMTTYTQFRNSRRVEDGYTIQSVAIRAKSKGRVRLASSNTHVKPIIDAGYLSNTDDLATLREGIKLARKLCNRPEWGEYLGEEVFPGTHVQRDEDIDEYIRNSVHTANALTGTCKMGTGKDCVVGPDLCVFGVKGLRVCDSSVIPQIPGGQTATPTVMIADRAAHYITNPPIPANIEVYQQPTEEESLSAPTATA
jgi:choline dehydrogenase-like flavoprotein